FGGRPPGRLASFPAAILPETVAWAAYIVLFVVVAVLVLRRLRLPAWWLLFPPLWESVELVNQDLLAVWLLLVPGAWSGIAVVCKSYAAIPLAIQGRWRALSVGLAVSLITLPLWLTFLQRWDEIQATLI